MRFEEKDIIDIRNSSETNVALAEKYGAHVVHISSIKRRKIWKHIN